MNKQPFYHEVTVLFTATRPLDESEVQALLEKSLKNKDIVKGTVQIDGYEDPEPGDPADLM